MLLMPWCSSYSSARSMAASFVASISPNKATVYGWTLSPQKAPQHHRDLRLRSHSMAFCPCCILGPMSSNNFPSPKFAKRWTFTTETEASVLKEHMGSQDRPYFSIVGTLRGGVAANHIVCAPYLSALSISMSTLIGSRYQPIFWLTYRHHPLASIRDDVHLERPWPQRRLFFDRCPP